MKKNKYSDFSVDERVVLARTAESADTLKELANDKEPRVRKAVAFNLATPYYTLKKLYKDQNNEVSQAAEFTSQFLL